MGLITEAEQARNIAEMGNAQVESSNNVDSKIVAEEAEAAIGMTEQKPAKAPMAAVIRVARQRMREPGFVLKVA